MAERQINLVAPGRILDSPRQRLYAHSRAKVILLKPAESRLTDGSGKATMQELLSMEPRRQHLTAAADVLS